MKTKHTPGPWVAIGPLPDRALIAHRARKPKFKEGLWYVLPEDNVERYPIAVIDAADDCSDSFRKVIAPADALLIAAAPEMLEALKYARKCIAYCRKHHPDAQRGDGVPAEAFIDSVIAKAEVGAK